VTSDLRLALELAGLADAITLERFRAADLRVETKADHSPVSDVDRRVEEVLRRRIVQARPADAVLGEEDGLTGGGERRWLLDPIDGTRNYVRGVPVWATLIALEVGDDVEVGVISAPALGRRWWAARGQGASAAGTRLRVSGVRLLADAYISTSDARGMDAVPGMRRRYDALAARCWTARGLGDFWQHMLVAEGCIDVAVEMPVAAWDIAASLVIVEEAGGRLTDLAGARRLDSGSVLVSNGLLHDVVVEALRPPDG